ncbi:hypothetical protein CY34DRAFT_761378 [Suillus luteus UH-Slu-Lm8-n1]|uniref:Uncharacterized protein n=1 Tax=Suillus luteus UH-Slu-Lm8-n1 TaxID=930992 RepID=A0A0D0A1N2_9AGAM|nr:hypothetical protein CY34DRAFT_761378 [Suillus luteus UH-Slu-Lm8-n1]
MSDAEYEVVCDKGARRCKAGQENHMEISFKLGTRKIFYIWLKAFPQDFLGIRTHSVLKKKKRFMFWALQGRVRDLKVNLVRTFYKDLLKMMSPTILTTKKRRRNQKPTGEPRAKRKRESEPGTAGNASTQRMRAFGPKSKARSSPLISPDDPDARDIPNSHADLPEVNGTLVQFDDLRSYSPDIQDTIEFSRRTRDVALFDSPSQSRNSEGPKSPAETAVPAHRTRAANPLVKFIDAVPSMGKNSRAVIPAKTRLVSGQPSISSKNNGSQASHKTRPKPAPGGRFGGKNRSSLLIAVKGGLTSGKVASGGPTSQDTIEVSHVLTENAVLSADEGRSSLDPLFDSPSQSRNSEGPRSPAEPAVPAHHTRAADILVKFIDAVPTMGKNSGAAIPAKTRLSSRGAGQE